MLKFMDVLGCWNAAELNQLLGVGGTDLRHWCWCWRYEEEAEGRLLDRRIDKASGRRMPVDRCDEVERRYQDFTARHFHEQSVAESRASRCAPAQAATSSAAWYDAASSRRDAPEASTPKA